MNYYRISFLTTCLGLIVAITGCNNVFAQKVTEAEKVFKNHSAPVKALAFSPDGKILASGGDDKIICFCNIQTGELSGKIENYYAVKALQFATNDNILAASGSDIKLMDKEGKPIRTFSGYTTDVWSLAYNVASQKIAAGSYAKYIKVWDFNTGKLLLTLEGHEKSCLPVCFNTAGNLIASGSLDKSVRLWDAVSGNEIKKLEIHSNNIFAVAFHPSGKYVASASADKTIRLWSVDSGRVVRTYSGHSGAVFDVQFSPDGNHMLSCGADKIIFLWETATGKKLYSFLDHTGSVNSVRFSPDGSSFASASDDNTIMYWRLKKKYFLAGSIYESKIDEAVSKSPLFEPRGDNESKQDYSSRMIEADKYLEGLYDQYYKEYIGMLNQLPFEK